MKEPVVDLEEPVVADLSDFEKVDNRPRCWFKRLDAEQKAKVMGAYEAKYPITIIAKVVTGWGIPIGRSTCSAHFSQHSKGCPNAVNVHD